VCVPCSFLRGAVVVDDAARFTDERDDLWTNEGFADILAMIFVRRNGGQVSPLPTLGVSRRVQFRKWYYGIFNRFGSVLHFV
jgi:hypothetical protein